MLRAALKTLPWWAPRIASAVSSTATSRRAAEGEAIERALLWGRCVGGVVIITLGPAAAPSAPTLSLYALGLYFIAYAVLMVRLSRAAQDVGSRGRLLWLAHGFDTVGFVGALALNATDPQWIAVTAAPLYVLVTVARLGTLGGLLAAVALSVAHVALAAWRDATMGIAFDTASTLVHVAIYGLAALLAGALDVEIRRLRAQRDLQVTVHEPLLEAHDDLRQGVLISEGGRALYVSVGLTRMTGWSPDEIKAMPSVMDLIPSEDRAAAIAATSALPAWGGNLTKRLRCRDGRHIDVEVALRRFEHEGRSRTVAIIRDVTLRQRTLEELERMHRLDSLGALAGGLAHDFNSLLAVIVNNAYLALDPPDGVGRREVEQIRDVAHQGVDLTRQMLAFARGLRSARPGRVDIRGEVASAEPLLRRAVGPGVALEMRVAPHVRAVVLEEGAIARILMNLVANARDALPHGGTVAIDVNEVDVDASDVPTVAAGRYVRIAVRDDGIGMTPDVVERAFEPFFTTKPKDQGTGLGLATVYRAVRDAGGHVGIASAPGRGSTITIHLPAVDVPSLVPVGTA